MGRWSVRAIPVDASAREFVAHGAASEIVQARAHAAMATAEVTRPIVADGGAALVVITVDADQTMMVVEPRTTDRRRDTITADSADILHALSAAFDPPDRAADRLDDG